MSKLKVPYHRLVNAGFPAKINNSAQGSSAPMQPHLAPGRAAGTIKAGKKTTPESLFLTCQAGFRCMRGRRVRERLSSPGSSTSSISPQCFQHKRFNILKSCFIMLCRNSQHIFVNSWVGQRYKCGVFNLSQT